MIDYNYLYVYKYKYQQSNLNQLSHSVPNLGGGAYAPTPYFWPNKNFSNSNFKKDRKTRVRKYEK